MMFPHRESDMLFEGCAPGPAISPGPLPDRKSPIMCRNGSDMWTHSGDTGWRVRWAVLLTAAWIVWLAGSAVAWKQAATRPAMMEGIWETPKHLAYAASALYAGSRSLSYSSEATTAWPDLVQDQDLLRRLLGEPVGQWYSFQIPESPDGTYTPNLQGGQYPPLAYLVGALGIAACDLESTGAQAATNLLLLAFVSVMAWHGWQLAGFRGAALLGLAAAASPWTSQWLRVYNYQPGALLMLALAMVAAHASRGLTRPLFCACIGAALGIGTLFTQLVLFAATPWLIALALPDLFKTRYSLLAGGLLLLIAQIMQIRYQWAIQVDPSPDWLSPCVTAVVLLILLLLGCTAWLHAGKHGWRPATGLAVTVAVTGMVGGPYFLFLQEVQLQGIRELQTLPYDPVLLIAWRSIQTIHAFHWLGLLWLLVGALAMVGWRGFGSLGLRLAFSVPASMAAISLGGSWSLKYQVLVLPLALVLGFLWAARWKRSFVPVMLLLLGGLWIQTFGWLHVEKQQIPWLPVSLLTPDFMQDHTRPVPRDWWYSFPVAELLGEEPWQIDQIPAEGRICLVFLDQDALPTFPDPAMPQPRRFKQWDMECLAMFLGVRGQLIEPSRLKVGDQVLIASVFPYCTPPEPQAGSAGLSAPDHFRLGSHLVADYLYLKLQTVRPGASLDGIQTTLPARPRQAGASGVLAPDR